MASTAALMGRFVRCTRYTVGVSFSLDTSESVYRSRLALFTLPYTHSLPTWDWLSGILSLKQRRRFPSAYLPFLTAWEP